jgi:hypothetical protein
VSSVSNDQTTRGPCAWVLMMVCGAATRVMAAEGLAIALFNAWSPWALVTEHEFPVPEPEAAPARAGMAEPAALAELLERLPRAQPGNFLAVHSPGSKCRDEDDRSVLLEACRAKRVVLQSAVDSPAVSAKVLRLWELAKLLDTKGESFHLPLGCYAVLVENMGAALLGEARWEEVVASATLREEFLADTAGDGLMQYPQFEESMTLFLAAWTGSAAVDRWSALLERVLDAVTDTGISLRRPELSPALNAKAQRSSVEKLLEQDPSARWRACRAALIESSLPAALTTPPAAVATTAKSLVASFTQQSMKKASEAAQLAQYRLPFLAVLGWVSTSLVMARHTPPEASPEPEAVSVPPREPSPEPAIEEEREPPSPEPAIEEEREPPPPEPVAVSSSKPKKNNDKTTARSAAAATAPVRPAPRRRPLHEPKSRTVRRPEVTPSPARQPSLSTITLLPSGGFGASQRGGFR